MSAVERYDCIVIGAGHNGLVCAAYLARAGRSVLVLEAGGQSGGAAVTQEFAPGYRVSACAHLLYCLNDAIVRELALPTRGLGFVSSTMVTSALSVDGPALTIGPEGLSGSATAADHQAHERFRALTGRLSRGLAAVLRCTPPRLGTSSWADRRALLALGWRLRRLGRADLRELLRIGGMNVYDLLEDTFESPLLKGALGLDAVLGSNFGPRSPGSAFTWLYRLAASADAYRAGSGALLQPRGGLGAVCEALAGAAEAAGARIRLRAPVARILVERDRASGVLLESGERLEAGSVISSADPKTTFMRLLGAEHLDAGFVRQLVHLRTNGLAAKLHLALDALPTFTGVSHEALAGRLVVAPSLDYLERAFNPCKYGEFSPDPALEITVPTFKDPTLAPSGGHVLSAVVQYAPYALAGGWDAQRDRLTRLVIELLERYAPGITGSIRAAELLTPLDIERRFRITGGHWHHAELALDQFFFVRPVPGAAQYDSPVEGLYLCGAGCHPGGGVMGTAGRNAAQRILGRAA